jgi:hypothetical protein
VAGHHLISPANGSSNSIPDDIGRAENWHDRTEPPSIEQSACLGLGMRKGVAFESAKQLREYEERRLEEQKALSKLGIVGGQRESERLFSVYPGPAWYRKEVTIPASWRGKISG